MIHKQIKKLKASVEAKMTAPLLAAMPRPKAVQGKLVFSEPLAQMAESIYSRKEINTQPEYKRDHAAPGNNRM